MKRCYQLIKISLIAMLLLLTTSCFSPKIQPQLTTGSESVIPTNIDDNEATPAAIVPSRKLVLGYSQVGAESDWRKANTLSIQQAASEAGIDLRFKEAEQKQSNQIEAIRQFIKDKVDVIAFSPIVQSGWESILREAKQAGIPVIITDRAIDVTDPSLYVTYLGSDFNEEGRRAGKYIQDVMKNITGSVHIVELQGTVGSSPTIDRKKGFEEIIKTNPQLKIMLSESGNFTFDQGKIVMEAFLKNKGKDIQVLYAHNDDMALGAIEAIEQYGLKPGKDIIIVSVDGTRKGLEAMIADKINYIVECNPLFGPQLMQAVKELIAGKILPKRIVTKDDIFTKDDAVKVIDNRKY